MQFSRLYSAKNGIRVFCPPSSAPGICIRSFFPFPLCPLPIEAQRRSRRLCFLLTMRHPGDAPLKSQASVANPWGIRRVFARIQRRVLPGFNLAWCPIKAARNAAHPRRPPGPVGAMPLRPKPTTHKECLDKRSAVPAVAAKIKSTGFFAQRFVKRLARSSLCVVRRLKPDWREFCAEQPEDNHLQVYPEIDIDTKLPPRGTPSTHAYTHILTPL